MDENNKWFWGLGAGVVLLMSMPLWNKKQADTKDCVGCGCKDCGEKKRAESRVTRGEEVFNSEMNQDVSGPSGELNRINPVEVGGAEDVYGAESFNAQSSSDRRWIKHKGKMVATNFPEGVTPDNWRENNPTSYTDCNVWQDGGRSGAYEVIPTFLKIKKGWPDLWNGGHSYYLNYDDITSDRPANDEYYLKQYQDGWVWLRGRKTAEDVLDAHYQRFPNQTDSYIPGHTYGGQNIQCGNKRHKYIMTGQWIDESGGLTVNGQTYDEYYREQDKGLESADFDRQMQREKDETKKPNETDYDYHDRQLKAWEQKLKQGHAIEEVQKYLDYHRARMIHYSQGKRGSGAVQQGGQQAPHQPGQPPIAQPNAFAAPTLKQYNTEYVNMNPLDYQTPTSFSQVSGYASQPFWDQANDMLPEYRYAMPWSSSYLPVNEWRPNDQQGWPAGPLPFDPRTR